MQKGPEYLKSNAKRGFDVLGAAAVGFAILPTAAIGYAAAAFDNRSARPFYTHERIGLDGRIFNLTKLRTLRPELVGDEHQEHGAYDLRASKIGVTLRRYGIDEIPQLQNVLEGEMSLVGVRAATEDNIKFLEDTAPDLFEEWYDTAYSQGKPALIGPAQLYRHRFVRPSEEIFRRSLEIDIEYAKNASLLKDLRILGSAPLKLLAANIKPIEAEMPPAAVLID